MSVMWKSVWWRYRQTEAEYALCDIQKSIGISDYELGQALPKDFRGILSTIEEIEKELETNNEWTQYLLNKCDINIWNWQ